MMSHTDAKVALRRASFASLVGTTIEWYDFFIYGSAAALVFNKIFFSSLSPQAGTIAAFATFALGFVARGIGAILFGHFGDRTGRKRMLIFTLILMGVSTVGIGLLPSFDTIGVAAPILLIILRMVQGVAMAGEWGGAVLIAAEKAKASERTWYGAFAQHGAPLGIILASAVFSGVTSLPNDAFLSWAWRIPFLLSAVLVVIGYLIRMSVEESDDFVRAREQQKLAKVPLVTLFRVAWPIVLLMVGVDAVSVAGSHFRNTYLLSWAASHTTLAKPALLQIYIVASVFTVITQVSFARLSIYRSVKSLLIISLLIYALTPFPMFWLAATNNILLAGAGITLCAMCGGAFYALIAGYSSSVFPTNVRYSGISVSYQGSAMLFASITPLLSTVLVESQGGAYWPAAALYTSYCGISLLSLLGLWAYQRRATGSEAELALGER
jgi:MFS family permease